MLDIIDASETEEEEEAEKEVEECFLRSTVLDSCLFP